MNASLQKWGNSQGIRISKAMLEALQWCENEQVDIYVYDGKLIIEKLHKDTTLSDLFADYDADYKPVEVDSGEPVGGEVW